VAPGGEPATTAPGVRMSWPRSPPVVLVVLLPAFLLASCADNWLVGYSAETNFLTFDHPNSEKAATEVRAEAERLCQQRRQAATRTESICSLTQCATTYQCEDKEDMIRYGS